MRSQFTTSWGTCKLCGTDLLRCSLFNLVGRTKLRHDFALKLHESKLVPIDDRTVPVSLSFVVTINGIFVWSCNEFLLIFTKFMYGINSNWIVQFYRFQLCTYWHLFSFYLLFSLFTEKQTLKHSFYFNRPYFYCLFPINSKTQSLNDQRKSEREKDTNYTAEDSFILSSIIHTL